jgi:hypothetical protein
VDDQVSVALAPELTEVGFAPIDTVGAGTEAVLVTVTVVEAWAFVFALPAQVRLKVLAAVSGPLVIEPLVDFVPDHAPDAVHCVASDDDQVSITDPPLATD